MRTAFLNLALLMVAILLSSCRSRGTPYFVRPSNPSQVTLSAAGTTIYHGDTYSMGLWPTAFNADPITFLLGNAGEVNLLLSDLVLGGTDSSEFAITTEPAYVVSPGTATSFDLDYRPTIAGTKSATLTIPSNDPTNVNFQVNLTAATSWGSRFVDGNAANVGINKNSIRNADNVVTCSFNSNLYAVWHETNGPASQIRVAVYNDNLTSPAWTFVDGNDALNGINFDPDYSALNPTCLEFNSKLYVLWSEFDASSVAQIRVAVYNGNDLAPSWTFVDGNAASGINVDSTHQAADVHAAVLGTKMYVTWREDNNGTVQQARVAVYNGDDAAPAFSFVDGGNPAVGLNKSVVRNCDFPKLVAVGSKLYLTWHEFNGSVRQIRVAVYNGNDSAASWDFADGDNPDGINKNILYDARYPYPVVLNSKLYIMWQERDAANVYQTTVAVYNGDDSAPSYSFIENNGAQGLNKDVTKNAYRPRAVVVGTRFYITWFEDDGTADSVRVAAYNGDDTSPLWRFLDGDGVSGLNKTTTHDARASYLVHHANRLYLAWPEDDGSSNFQIRINAANN